MMPGFIRSGRRGFARLALLPVLAALGVLTAEPASDPVAVYATIDRVVLTPDASNPTAIQVYGTFSQSAHEPGDRYGPAVRGYMYFSLDQARQTVIRAEWADLQRAAGTKQIIGFGAKYSRPVARIRCATEAVAAPDVYHTGVGIVRAVPNTNTVASHIKHDLEGGAAPAARCKS